VDTDACGGGGELTADNEKIETDDVQDWNDMM